MRLLVCGGRDYNNAEHAFAMLDYVRFAWIRQINPHPPQAR